MNMFSMMKDAFAMRAQLKEMQDALKAKRFQEARDGVAVTIDGTLEVVSVSIDPAALTRGSTWLESAILSAVRAATATARASIAEEFKHAASHGGSPDSH